MFLYMGEVPGTQLHNVTVTVCLESRPPNVLPVAFEVPGRLHPSSYLSTFVFHAQPGCLRTGVLILSLVRIKRKA